METNEKKRVAIFIDNSNVLHSLQKLRKVDSEWICLYDPLELAKKLVGNRELVAVYFYCAPPPSYLLTEGERGQKRHATTMKYYEVIKKLPKVELKFATIKGTKGNLIEKNLDTQLATDMLMQAALNQFDVAILVSNDGDYVSAVENIKTAFKKKVELFFFKGGLSMELRQNCDVARRARRSNFTRIYMGE